MVTRLSAAGLLPAGLIATTHAWAQQQDPGYYHGHMWNGGWYGGLFGPLMMILFIALVVIGVVILVRGLGWREPGQGSTGASRDRALDILKERFARGEIDKEEFEERRRALNE
jgi:putative membrane protein